VVSGYKDELPHVTTALEIDVKCNAIDGISYRYHYCGTVCMLEDKG
jgi:hypothetical protein